jgi:hypothetical protein
VADGQGRPLLVGGKLAELEPVVAGKRCGVSGIPEIRSVGDRVSFDVTFWRARPPRAGATVEEEAAAAEEDDWMTVEKLEKTLKKEDCVDWTMMPPVPEEGTGLSREGEAKGGFGGERATSRGDLTFL